MACEQPDSGSNHPRNFLSGVLTCLAPPAKVTSICRISAGNRKWDSGSGTRCQRRDKPEEVEWQTAAIEGKLDLLVRSTSVCPVPACSPISFCPPHLVRKRRYEHLGYASVYSSPSAAVDPAWESRSDWEIYKGMPKPFRKCAWAILAKKPTWYSTTAA